MITFDEINKIHSTFSSINTFYALEEPILVLDCFEQDKPYIRVYGKNEVADLFARGTRKQSEDEVTAYYKKLAADRQRRKVTTPVPTVIPEITYITDPKNPGILLNEKMFNPDEKTIKETKLSPPADGKMALSIAYAAAYKAINTNALTPRNDDDRDLVHHFMEHYDNKKEQLDADIALLDKFMANPNDPTLKLLPIQVQFLASFGITANAFGINILSMDLLTKLHAPLIDMASLSAIENPVLVNDGKKLYLYDKNTLSGMVGSQADDFLAYDKVNKEINDIVARMDLIERQVISEHQLHWLIFDPPNQATIMSKMNAETLKEYSLLIERCKECGDRLLPIQQRLRVARFLDGSVKPTKKRGVVEDRAKGIELPENVPQIEANVVMSLVLAAGLFSIAHNPQIKANKHKHECDIIDFFIEYYGLDSASHKVLADPGQKVYHDAIRQKRVKLQADISLFIQFINNPADANLKLRQEHLQFLKQLGLNADLFKPYKNVDLKQFLDRLERLWIKPDAVAAPNAAPNGLAGALANGAHPNPKDMRDVKSGADNKHSAAATAVGAVKNNGAAAGVKENGVGMAQDPYNLSNKFKDAAAAQALNNLKLLLKQAHDEQRAAASQSAVAARPAPAPAAAPVAGSGMVPAIAPAPRRTPRPVPEDWKKLVDDQLAQMAAAKANQEADDAAYAARIAAGGDDAGAVFAAGVAPNANANGNGAAAALPQPIIIQPNAVPAAAANNNGGAILAAAAGRIDLPPPPPSTTDIANIRRSRRI